MYGTVADLATYMMDYFIFYNSFQASVTKIYRALGGALCDYASRL